MPKCPICNSKKTKCTNWGQRIYASAVSTAAGTFMSMFGPHMGTAAKMEVSKKECPTRDYKCEDCGHKWFVER